MRVWSLKTWRSMAFQSRFFHSYTGVAAVLMTYAPLLLPLLTRKPDSRQRILSITPGMLLGSSHHRCFRLTPAPSSTRTESTGGVTSFQSFVLRGRRVTLSTGGRGMNAGQVEPCRIPTRVLLDQA